MEIAFCFYPGVKVVQPLTPYEVEKQGSVTYTRFTDGKFQRYRAGNIPFGDPIDIKQLIIKQTVDGAITRNEKAYDLWSNRASATYVPINDPLNGVKGFN